MMMMMLWSECARDVVMGGRNEAGERSWRRVIYAPLGVSGEVPIGAKHPDETCAYMHNQGVPYTEVGNKGTRIGYGVQYTVHEII